MIQVFLPGAEEPVKFALNSASILDGALLLAPTPEAEPQMVFAPGSWLGFCTGNELERWPDEQY